MTEDLIGKRFSLLTVTRRGRFKGRPPRRYWWCICLCGVEKEIAESNLKNGKTRSCGASVHRKNRAEDLIGRTFGALTVQSRQPTGNRKDRRARWVCICPKGHITIKTTASLTAKDIKCDDCQLIRIAPLRAAWRRAWQCFSDAKRRCNNPQPKDRKAYAGREFELPSVNAMVDAIGLPDPTQTLDRLNSKLGYTLTNIGWKTKKEQAFNRCNTIKVLYFGKWMSFTEAKKRLGPEKVSCAESLKNAGWDPQEAIDALSDEPSPHSMQYSNSIFPDELSLPTMDDCPVES